MKLKIKTDKFGVTTITCKGKAKETFDSFAASSYSLGNEWFLPFKYESKKKITLLNFSVNNLEPLDAFLRYSLLREQFAELLMGISNFLTYSREHSVQSDYVLFDTKFVLINREDRQIKFVYLPFKTPEESLKSLYDFLVDIGRKLKLANASQDVHLLQRYRDFFVLRELFSVTAFKDMVDSIYNETFNTTPDTEFQPPKTADLNMDCYEVLGGKENTFVYSAVVPEAGVLERGATETVATEASVPEVSEMGTGEPEKVTTEAGGPRAVTVVLTRKSNGQQFVCERFPFTIGSSAKSDFVVTGDVAISRMHAQIDLPADKSADGSVFTITDLGSTNGTYLKNKKLTPRKPFNLMNGDTIRLANEFFTFEVQK